MPPDQLSSITAGAVGLYRRGLALLLHGRAEEAIPHLRGAVDIDPRFAMANAALAVAQAEIQAATSRPTGHRGDRSGEGDVDASAGDRSGDNVGEEGDWRTPIERARRAGNLSRRERQHVAVVSLTLDGRLTRASALGREHLHEFPGDAVIVHVLTMKGVDLSDLCDAGMRHECD